MGMRKGEVAFLKVGPKAHKMIYHNQKPSYIDDQDY
jgi:hypothetical protein